MIVRRGDFVDQVKSRADGRRVAEALGLTGRGRRYFCPSCQAGADHKSPDLSVNETGFKCFKCGAAGDVIALVELVRGCDFKEALAWLAELTDTTRQDRSGMAMGPKTTKLGHRRTGEPLQRGL
jgi:DNA primase